VRQRLPANCGGPYWLVAGLLGRAQATPTVSLSQLFEFPQLGVRLRLPSDWGISQTPGVVNAGPGVDDESIASRTGFHMSLSCDLPLTLPELTRVESRGMVEVSHITLFTTSNITVDGHTGVGFWWTQPRPRDKTKPEYYLDVYVPAFNRVHMFVFHPPLLEADGKRLKPVGQAILESIRLFQSRN
jgi:hypothetical protein